MPLISSFDQTDTIPKDMFLKKGHEQPKPIYDIESIQNNKQLFYSGSLNVLNYSLTENESQLAPKVKELLKKDNQEILISNPTFIRNELLEKQSNQHQIPKNSQISFNKQISSPSPNSSVFEETSMINPKIQKELNNIDEESEPESE